MKNNNFEIPKEHLKEGRDKSECIDESSAYMLIAMVSGLVSRDPSTQVGACIVGHDNRILSIGYNGAPNGFDDKKFPWDREGTVLNTKYAYVCHAEMNAILNYRGSRKDLENAKIYVDLFPCNECAKLIIQSGIKEIIYTCDKYKDTDGVKASKRMLDECGVKYKQLKIDKEIIIKLKND